MKKLLLILLCFAIAMPVYAKGTGAKRKKTHVNSYVKQDGTSVSAHYRSTADKTKDNNWTAKGNTNPDTGKTGTR